MANKRVDWLAVGAGTIRLASGISFLVAPEAANRLWGDNEDSGATASLLLRSMGYRDALIGGLLLYSGLRGDASLEYHRAPTRNSESSIGSAFRTREPSSFPSTRRLIFSAAASTVKM